jgi:ammonium transporter, Amt family
MLEVIAQAGEIFPEQVTTNSLTQNLVYAAGTVGALFIVVGLLMLDAASVRRLNVFNSTIEKLVGFFIGFTVYFVIGFAIWNWQYNQAFEVPNALGQSIEDWWLGGTLLNDMAQTVDPAVFPGLNSFQIFVFFLAVFAGIVNILLHFAVSERMKASAYYVTSFVAAIVCSFLIYLTFGSASPVTNGGYHDFFGVGAVYLFPAGMALVFTRMLGQRPGMFNAHSKVAEYRTGNLWTLATGALLIFAALPMVILSCLFFFDPEALAVSVTMADTAVGIAFNNYGLAWAGGALTGALIAYRTRKYSYLLLGPFAGYVAGAAAMDVYEPWQMFLVSAGAPFLSYAVYEFLGRRHVDDHKLLPVFATAGCYGLIMVGLIDWGTAQGGYFGITEGDFAFQNAEVTVWWQLIGIGICLGAGIVTALVMGTLLKATIGLKVSDDEQAEGLDNVLWELPDEYELHGNGGGNGARAKKAAAKR